MLEDDERHGMTARQLRTDVFVELDQCLYVYFTGLRSKKNTVGK